MNEFNPKERTLARENILKILYQHDLNEYSFSAIKNDFIEKRQYDKDYFDNLIELYESNSNKIDTLIEKNSDIILQSLSPIDRSILRLAICELVFRKDVPKNVIINESINIAKKYSSKDAYKFINTMLDKLITKL